MVDTQELERIIEDKGKKKVHLAKTLNISIQSFRLKLNNRNEFKLSEVNRLCKELDITKLSDKEKIFFKE